MKMKKQIVFLLTTIVSLNCYSQISFEKGHFIDNNNQKTNCLIKNIDWANNPTEFEYKLSENNEPKKLTIKLVKEFGIDNTSKYIKSIVKLDISKNNINNLNNQKNPIFKEEELFLKVLIEGKSNLYEYVNGNLKRYFYTKEDSIIEQLIFKRYETNELNIAKNNRFRQQLWVNLKCPNFKMSEIQNLNYNKNDLVKIFTEYNECHNSNIKNFERKEKRDLFNLSFRPRLNKSSLSLNNAGTDFTISGIENTGFGFGIEVEFILPVNKNKWAIAIEPTYQSFKSEKSANANNVSGGILITEVDYNSIEIPVSLRHYFFLNNNSKIFVNVSYVFDLSSKSSIEIKRSDNSTFNSLEIKTRNNLAFGIGYKLNDKYGFEMRYQTVRELLSDYTFWNSNYNTLSIILGYSLF
jgi:hypothetical protein